VARGSVAPAEIARVRDAGYSDAEIIEILAHVALNTFTNYVNEALDTEIDFPRIDRAAA
jgi:alkylhydroperoxidase family enzyme